MKTLTMPVCPACGSRDTAGHGRYETVHNGIRSLHACTACGEVFSETTGTPMQGIKTPIGKVVAALRLRGEGMGLRATARILGAHKKTIAEWERRFAGMKPTLMLYGLCHAFIQLTFEGDEVYTVVGHRVDPADSTGWTAIVLERASRFLVDQQCGGKEASLFKKVMRSVAAYVRRTQDTTFLSDGERRYGNTLFELCARTVRTGKRGRPRKTLPKGCRVRLKNKGSQAHRRGRKRPKYQAPNPNIPTPRRIFPSPLSTPIIWKATMRRYGGATAPFGVEPIPMPRTPTPCSGPWTCICCSTTSSVRTGPPARYRPCDWVSWRPLCALKRS